MTYVISFIDVDGEEAGTLVTADCEEDAVEFMALNGFIQAECVGTLESLHGTAN